VASLLAADGDQSQYYSTQHHVQWSRHIYH